MQVLNLIREFELQRIKDSETVKDYSNRLLGSEFIESQIVQNILTALLERYEATITTQGFIKNFLNRIA